MPNSNNGSLYCRTPRKGHPREHGHYVHPNDAITGTNGKLWCPIHKGTRRAAGQLATRPRNPHRRKRSTVFWRNIQTVIAHKIGKHRTKQEPSHL